MAARIIGKTIHGALIYQGSEAERLAMTDIVDAGARLFRQDDGARYESDGAGSWDQTHGTDGVPLVSIAGSSGTGGAVPVSTSGWIPRAGVVQLPRTLLNVPVYAGHDTGAVVNSGTELAVIELAADNKATGVLITPTTRGSNLFFLMTVNAADDADAAARLRSLVDADIVRFKIVVNQPRFIPFAADSLGANQEIANLYFTAVGGTPANELDVEFF